MGLPLALSQIVSSQIAQLPATTRLLSMESLGLEPDVITESLRAAAVRAAASQASGHGQGLSVWRKAVAFAGRIGSERWETLETKNQFRMVETC